MLANDILEMSKICKTAMATFVDTLYNLLFNTCVSNIIIVLIAFKVLGYKDSWCQGVPVQLRTSSLVSTLYTSALRSRNILPWRWHKNDVFVYLWESWIFQRHESVAFYIMVFQSWFQTCHHACRCNTQIARVMGPTWGLPGSCRPLVGPMLAPWTLLSGYIRDLRNHHYVCRYLCKSSAGTILATKLNMLTAVFLSPNWICNRRWLSK